MKDLTRKVASIDVPDGTTVTFNKKRHHDFGSFQAIGPLSTCDRPSAYDILEVFEGLDHYSKNLFNHLKLHRDRYGRIACRRTVKVGSSEYKQSMRSITKLTKAGLLCPVKIKQLPLIGFLPNEYKSAEYKIFLLNPYFIRSRNQGDSLIYWKNLVKNNTT